MKRNDKLHIQISTDEKQKIRTRAESVGMTMAEYCRFILVNTKPKIEVT